MSSIQYAFARGDDDAPACANCAPIVGDRAPYRQNLQAAPPCEVESTDPRFCRCPKCSTRYRTPIHHVLGLMLGAPKP